MVSDGLPFGYLLCNVRIASSIHGHDYRHALQRFADGLVDLLALYARWVC